MLELFSYTLSLSDVLVLGGAALLSGMAKTGVAGVSMVIVPIMAMAFGGRESTGLMLTIIIFADLFGIWYYHSHASWQHLRGLLPSALFGVLCGTVVGQAIDDRAFRVVMAGIIFVSLGTMMWQELSVKLKIPSSQLFTRSIGIAGGFTTMVGNLAGPIMAIYLLAMKFPKNQFIGTGVWFFLAINLFKAPIHVLVWKTITWNSFLLTALFIPIIAIGALLGVSIVKNIADRPYRWFVIVMTGVAALVMLVNSDA